MGARRRNRWWAVAAAVLLVWLWSGCGPIEYVNQVTRSASSEVEAAKAAGADKHAPYYYTLAVQYLRKAREEASYADFQAANRFGRKATEAARKARAEAIARAADPDAGAELAPQDGFAPLLPGGVDELEDARSEP
jgi:uncharacterized membrane protein